MSVSEHLVAQLGAPKPDLVWLGPLMLVAALGAYVLFEFAFGRAVRALAKRVWRNISTAFSRANDPAKKR
jgi:hypothetical protein